MGFYEQISKYYDEIFPPGEEQISFIKECAGAPGNKVLDVACGSGGYAAELAQAGYKVTAVDIDSAMVKVAEEKFQDRGLDAKALQSDMKELGNVINDRFSSVFCIGNSIVHLGSTVDIQKALKQMHGLLNMDGVLILQIINYDRILKYGINELPPIHNEEAGITFIRQYQYNKEKEVINFKTILNVEEEDTRQSFENTVELLPLASNKLMELMEQARFRKIQFYGDFKKAPYNDTSYMLVAKAVK